VVSFARSFGDPITAVSSASARVAPNSSQVFSSSGASRCCSTHSPSVRSNTYAAPSPTPWRSESFGAVMTAVSASIATERPNCWADAASAGVSVAASCQRSPWRSNTYAAPALYPAAVSASAAPIRAVSSVSVTEQPTSSPPTASSGTSVAVCCHDPSRPENTYAAPGYSVSGRPTPFAPTRPSPSSSATDHPNSSSAPPSSGTSVAACRQPSPRRWNTAARPAFAPAGVSANGAPMRAESPAIATENPNRSPPSPWVGRSFAAGR
jgi:hypothetical protein